MEYSTVVSHHLEMGAIGLETCDIDMEAGWAGEGCRQVLQRSFDRLRQQQLFDRGSGRPREFLAERASGKEEGGQVPPPDRKFGAHAVCVRHGRMAPGYLIEDEM